MKKYSVLILLGFSSFTQAQEYAYPDYNNYQNYYFSPQYLNQDQSGFDQEKESSLFKDANPKEEKKEKQESEKKDDNKDTNQDTENKDECKNDDKKDDNKTDDEKKGDNGKKDDENKDDNCKKDDEKEEPERRALPAPFESPPFPSAEYQGYPLIGVPPDDTEWPLMASLKGSFWGDVFKYYRIRLYGWFNESGNVSNCKNSNSPFSYWLVPNRLELDQFVFRIERQVDSVQTDHIDWGFRSSFLYGIDYRYMTAGGWTSWQLLKKNRLYGYDFTEQYLDVYFPRVVQGMIVRVGRWIACPDIETQFAPDNYMGSHSILFTFDTYTQTGIMATIMINENWTVQGCIHAGTDMAPWYKGALPTGMFGVRWVSSDNNDSVYLVLNSINAAKFRRFHYCKQPAGHDNFNYLVGTWQHRFNKYVHTKTEGYFMWQRDAVLGGTPSIGPVKSFGGGGGIGPNIKGTCYTFGVVNYTMFLLSKDDFITVRNEYWRDVQGERSGFPGTYSSNALGWTHFISPILIFRPEVGYYRNWSHRAFDLGKRRALVMLAADLTLRF